jgi:radical SAM superfamily enzyme YgiQ (UPF0313 family)
MRIALVLSTNRSYRDAVDRGKAYSSYAPTTLIQLASLVPPELHAEVRTYDLVRDRLPETLDADLVGISTITCGASEAYRIADRERRRGAVVVLGGSHPTALPAEALGHADAVVAGFAERTWPRLVRDFAAGSLQRLYRDFGNPFERPLPFADHRLLRGRGYFFTRTLEASRGCANRCAFCATQPHGREWTRPAGEVLDEAETLGRSVLFLDSNHAGSSGRQDGLWEGLRERGIRWYGAATVAFAGDRAAVARAASHGCRGLLVGFESISDDSLAAADKQFNRGRDYAAVVRLLHDHGIMLLGCFVFGLDGDDASVFDRTVELVQRAGVDLVHHAIATPLPGTRWHAQLRASGRLLTDDWELYDTEHVVFRPLGMTVEQLYEGHLRAWRETYRVSRLLQRAAASGFRPTSLAGTLGFRRLATTFDRSHCRAVPGAADCLRAASARAGTAPPRAVAPGDLTEIPPWT